MLAQPSRLGKFFISMKIKVAKSKNKERLRSLFFV